MNCRLIAITLAIAALAASVSGEEGASAPVSGKRQPKLFYISSSTTTSTVSTSTVCFKSGTALATCSKKKRKRDIMSELLEDASAESIKPSRNSRMDEEELEDAVDLLEAAEKETENQRDPKFLLYWATLTSTSTSTSYTATVTIHSLECTPSGFGTSLC